MAANGLTEETIDLRVRVMNAVSGHYVTYPPPACVERSLVDLAETLLPKKRISS